MHNFRELKIWKRSRELVSENYKTTKQFPADELYGLTSQIRRCSVSIPANISEDCGRTITKELIRFLDIANGSAFELETLLIIANDLNYLNSNDIRD